MKSNFDLPPLKLTSYPTSWLFKTSITKMLTRDDDSEGGASCGEWNGWFWLTQERAGEGARRRRRGRQSIPRTTRASTRAARRRPQHLWRRLVLIVRQFCQKATSYEWLISEWERQKLTWVSHSSSLFSSLLVINNSDTSRPMLLLRPPHHRCLLNPITIRQRENPYIKLKCPHTSPSFELATWWRIAKLESAGSWSIASKVRLA